MKFEEIMGFFREGKKIRRSSWEEYKEIISENDEFNYFEIPYRDLFADDWEIVE